MIGYSTKISSTIYIWIRLFKTKKNSKNFENINEWNNLIPAVILLERIF